MMSNKISIYTALFIILTAFVVQIREKKWDTDFGVVQGDVKGYYAYLPLLFIYDDIKIEHYGQYAHKNNNRIWCAAAPNGTNRIKYTMGMAILYTPFFFIAHVVASVTDYPSDGYSLPYQLMLAMSALFFLVAGIFVLRKMLKIYFNDLVVAITLLVIFLGTNLFIYFTEKMCVSHGYSFVLIALFLYASIMWLNNQKLKWTIVVGISGGLMILIRPVDIIFFLFPLLFNIGSWHLFLHRLKLFRKHYLHTLVVALLSFLVFLPQLIYWKYITGHFVYDSYTNEYFYFLNPKIFRAVFSYRNGWLVYTPVLLFSFVGIFQLRRRLPQFFTPIVVIVPIYIYVIASWWCWWYAGFGNRAFINLYPLLAVAVAVFIQYVLQRKTAIKFAYLIVFFGFILFNLFQTYQMSVKAIHWENMSKASYWDSFGRLGPTQLFPTYLSSLDVEKAKEGKYVILKPTYQNLIDEYIDFENLNNPKTISLDFDNIKVGPSFSGEKSIYSQKNKLYVMNVKFPLLNADEVYVTVWIKNSRDCAAVLASIDSIPFYKTSKEYIQSENDWKKINIFVRFTKLPKPDSLQFYIYNTAKQAMWLDDLYISTRKVDYQEETIKFDVFKN